MTREEALEVLTVLPPVGISTAIIGPGDVILIECLEDISKEMRAQMKQTLGDVWPGRKVIVVERQYRLRIVRDEEP